MQNLLKILRLLPPPPPPAPPLPPTSPKLPEISRKNPPQNELNKETKTTRKKIARSGHPRSKSWRPEAPEATFGAPRGSLKLKNHQKHKRISPFSRRPQITTSSLGARLLPPRGLRAEPRSAPRGRQGLEKGSRWRSNLVKISTIFGFVRPRKARSVFGA
mgnify:CR=1 FL=1